MDLVDEFCYVGDTLSVDGDADVGMLLWLPHLQWLVSSGHWLLSSLPKMFPCCCEEKFMMHVYGAGCYTLVICHWKEKMN